jgi:folate-binding Fe-S cluster repair protein YgfZ
MGQELTARTHYRALIKKRLVPVRIEGPPPEPGTTIRAGEAEAGIMRSSCDGMGLALLRKDAINAGAPLSAGSARLAPEPPGWMRFSP